ncbi:hypothetical protein J6590_048607 [Homalodisca vitripennis]|nr:hypothetical protein J6590_048607 [Homalodisca vitripennis]
MDGDSLLDRITTGDETGKIRELRNQITVCGVMAHTLRRRTAERGRGEGGSLGEVDRSRDISLSRGAKSLVPRLRQPGPVLSTSPRTLPPAVSLARSSEHSTGGSEPGRNFEPGLAKALTESTASVVLTNVSEACYANILSSALLSCPQMSFVDDYNIRNRIMFGIAPLHVQTKIKNVYVLCVDSLYANKPNVGFPVHIIEIAEVLLADHECQKVPKESLRADLGFMSDEKSKS